MKKTILVFIISSLFCKDALCQVTKGNWLAGGAASFSSLKNKSDVVTIDKSNQILIQFSADIGYFFFNKFAAGFKPSLESSKVVSGPIDLSGNIYAIGPFVRYYFLPTNNRYINILSEISYQYGIKSGKGVSIIHSNNISGLIGCEAFFNESVGIEFTIGYSSSKYTESAGALNTIIASIGFQFHLGKNN